MARSRDGWAALGTGSDRPQPMTTGADDVGLLATRFHRRGRGGRGPGRPPRPGGGRRRPELHEQRARPAARRQRAADVQVRAGEIQGQGHRRQLRQGGDRRAAADLQGHRRRLDEARAGGDARAALARHGGRVGVRHRGPRPHDGHRPAGQRRDRTTSSPATSGTSPAAMATCSSASATSPATSS